MARIKISQAAKEFNISISTVVEQLAKKGVVIDGNNPNTRLDENAYNMLVEQFQPERARQRASAPAVTSAVKEQAAAPSVPKLDPIHHTTAQVPRVIGKIELDKHGEPVRNKPPRPVEEQMKPAPVKSEEKAQEVVKTEVKPAEPVKKEDVAQPSEKPAKEAAKSATSPKVATTEKPVEKTPAEKPEAKEVEVKAEPKPEVKNEEKAEPSPATAPEAEVFTLNTTPTVAAPKVVGHIDLAALNQSTRPKKKTKEERRNERVAKDRQNQPGAPASSGDKKKRRRISGKEKIDIEKAGNDRSNTYSSGSGNSAGNGNQRREQSERQRGKDRAKRQAHVEVNDVDVQKQVRETLARLTHKDKAQKKGAKWRKEKREAFASRATEAAMQEAAESKTLKLTEFVTANDLAVMMDVPVNNVIATCMNLGVMVSINQRLDAETINIVAEEFGFTTEYVSAEVVEAIHQEEDTEDQLMARPPIVTVMGHVDHGKTSLLDYIRNANVIAGEAGGITQHIGAYNVKLPDGRRITFLDTPGHEAFTAMRARGAKVTDLCIIIVAADDNVMPQTVEAINHASAAGVPIVFAINKIDKPAANPDKIKEELAQMNYLVEEWGGKYQSQDISAKKGLGVEELMEKVLLEAELLDLKANPERNATGSIIESSLDKGRGYVATVLVQNGTLRQGDIILAGTHYGKIKAMFNERNQRITEAGPATPALILGLNGAPTAGDTFNVMDTEQEAREIATKREQLQRELGLRTNKRTTLEEIGRRRAIGNFHELNIIVKGDVDGSIEALSDSLIKLSTEEIKINVLHKAVGEISESDVTLASASDAIIIGFQVRPSQAARRAAEHEGVEIRLYSVIYQAIEEVKDAMEGMLAPEIKEEVIGSAEVLQTFHISKVGTIAGAIVREGRIKRSCKVRLIRDGIVRYTGELGSLKRLKDDVKEVTSGYDCGLSIAGYNDIREHDIVEAFEEVEVKKSL